ncbi:tryptophan transporter [Lentibacillus halodurans]|uniref:tryptophan transporter n=1 Tax=Lentibacillus halodurans TaxID=237679 RepID=UPI0031397CD0
MISDSVFLTVALYIIGLMEGVFPILFVTVVLSAAALNTVFMIIVYPLVQSILKQSWPLTPA